MFEHALVISTRNSDIRQQWFTASFNEANIPLPKKFIYSVDMHNVAYVIKDSNAVCPLKIDDIECQENKLLS